MADKRFPDQTPYKATPHNNDGILLSDSEATPTPNVAAMTTIQQLVAKIESNLDFSSLAYKDDVLTIGVPHNPIVGFPSDDWHPAHKQYVDVAKQEAMDYTDTELALHLDDYDHLATKHDTDTDALSGAIDDHKADTANPHSVTQNQVGLDGYTWSPIDLPMNTDTETYVDGQVATLSAAILASDIEPIVYTGTHFGDFTPDVFAYNHFDLLITNDITLKKDSRLASQGIGYSGTIVIKQDVSGGSNLLYDPEFKFPAGAPTLNTDPNAFNVFKYTVVAFDTVLMEFVADWV